MIPFRPHFARPPLVEQAITVMFDPIEGFSIGHFGLFWAQIRSEFPRTEVREPLDNILEDVGAGFRAPQFEVRMISPGFMQRCFYWSDSGDEAIQVQADRFTFNWRGADGASYPHAESTKARFDMLFQRFSEFVSQLGQSRIAIRQCEIVNVNIVPVLDFGASFADAPTFFRIGVADMASGFLPVESYQANTQHQLLDDNVAVGRLYTSLSPVVRVEDDQKAYRLEITVRGAPADADLDPFFDTARTAINSAFMGVTTPIAHAHWGLENG